MRIMTLIRTIMIMVSNDLKELMKLSVNLHLPLILEYLGFVTDKVLKVVMSNLDNYYTEKILFSPVRGRILSSACGTVV